MDPCIIIFKTLLFYSLAEYQNGYVSEIEVSTEQNHISIRDNGRGHAVDRLVDGVPYLQLVYSHLRFPDKETLPNVQLHALGMSIINEFSKTLEIKIMKSAQTTVVIFENGEMKATKELPNPGGKTGNLLSIELSEQICSSKIDAEKIRAILVSTKNACRNLNLFFNGKEISIADNK